ncbi:lysosomal alpha-mannosidase [Rhipicephalus sanguineus]|uniref:lysosomal alpha-mannosidase n=1 Tax=Rhipicephalus sanguineus TaxID=34632 RepID=UPI0020C39204|nr:lysosomal alpha-mannosidase [Rhipicephalus sanguineus]
MVTWSGGSRSAEEILQIAFSSDVERNHLDDEDFSLDGNVVQEIQQVFDSWITQVIRLYKGLDLIEFEWMTGSYGKERNRQLENYRFTVLPVVSWVYIKDVVRNMQMTVLPDSSQGTASLHDGEIELMVHRRLVEDDGCGLGEALNDTSVVRGRHWVHLGTSGWPRMRQQALQLVYAPVLSYYKLGRESLDGMLVTGNFSGLREELPDNAHLLTLEAVSASRILIRLEHINIDKNDKDANDKLISITHLLRSNQLEDVHEASLSGHMLLDEMRRLQWRQTQTSGGPSGTIGGSGVVREQDNYSVQLSDGRIRTFYASLSPKTR